MKNLGSSTLEKTNRILELVMLLSSNQKNETTLKGLPIKANCKDIPALTIHETYRG